MQYQINGYVYTVHHAYTCAHIYTRTYTHAYIYVCMWIYTCVHVYSLSWFFLISFVCLYSKHTLLIIAISNVLRAKLFSLCRSSVALCGPLSFHTRVRIRWPRAAIATRTVISLKSPGSFYWPTAAHTKRSYAYCYWVSVRLASLSVQS